MIKKKTAVVTQLSAGVTQLSAGTSLEDMDR